MDTSRRRIWPPQISNVFLQIQYQGDVARLCRENHLLDDNFWNGTTWTIGVKDLKAANFNARFGRQLLLLSG
jgi:hypothetical protein